MNPQINLPFRVWKFEKEEEQRLAGLLLLIISMYILGSLILIVVDQVWGDKTLLPLLVFGIGFQFLPLYAIHKGRLTIGNYHVIGGYIFLITLFATAGMGLRDYAILMYPTIILFSGLTEKLRGLALSTLLTLAALTWLIVGDMQGWYTPENLGTPNLLDLFIVTMLVLISVATVWLLVKDQDARHAQIGLELAKRIEMEVALKENEELFRSLAENNPDYIIRYNRQLRHIYANEAYLRASGKTWEEYIGKTHREMGFDQSLVELWEEKLRMVFDDGKPQEAEFEWEGTNGKVYFDWRVIPEFGEDGTVVSALGVSRDITNSVQMMESLRKSEEKFSEVFHHSPLMMAISDAAMGTVLDVNQQHIDVSGYTREEWLKKTPLELNWISPESRTRLLEIMKADGHVREHDLVVRAKDGRLVPVIYHGFFIEINGQRHIVSISQDVTERGLMGEALRTFNERFELAQEAAGIGVWDWNVVSGNIEWNNKMFDLFGLDMDKDTASFDSWRRALHSEDLEAAEARIMRALKDHVTLVNEYRVVPPDGQIHWINAVGRGVYDDRGEPLRMIGICLDVTERKQAEEALRESEEKYRNLYNNAEVAMFRTKLDGSGFIEVNEKLCDIIGCKREELIGRPTSINWADPAEREVMVRMLKAEGRIKNFEWNLLTKSGEVRNCLTSLKLYEKKGILEGSFIDITEHKLAEERLRAAEAKYRDIFENALNGIFQSTPEGGFLRVNDAMARVYGYESPDEMIASIGNNIASKIYVDPSQRAEFSRMMEQNSMVSGFEAKNLRKDGSIIWTSTNARAIRDEHGGVKYYEGFLEDVTARKEAEAAVERVRKLLAAILDILPVGVCLTDELGYYRMMNDAYCTIYEYGKGEMIGKHYGVIMPPGQLEMANAHYTRLLSGDVGIPTERKRQRKDGSIVYIEAANALVQDVDGQKMVITTVRDITERKHTEEELRESEAHFREVFDNTAHGTFIIEVTEGGNFRIGDRNRAEEILTSVPREAVMGKTLDEAFPPGMARMLHTNYRRSIEAGKPIAYEENIDLPGVGPKSYYTTLAPVKDKTGRFHRIIGSTFEITERKQMEEKLRDANETLRIQLDEIRVLQETLREQAIRDPLTGLYNRRYLDETMEREIARAKREVYPISLMIIDLDKLKYFNDSYGHNMGDQMLITLGALLQDSIRIGDIACRYGGDEFIVVMPGAGTNDAQQRAETIRQKYHDTAIRHGGEEIESTISIGISIFPRHGNDGDALIRSADKALYRAKESSRNRVILWQEDG